MITVLPEIALPTVANPVIGLDGELRETMGAVVDLAEAAGLSCLGVCAVDDYETAMWQHLPEVVDVADLDRLKTLDPVDIVVVGPTALLGASIGHVVARIQQAMPGAGIVSATGVRLDIPVA